MSLRCYWGFCHRTDNDLTAGIPSGISIFEASILARLSLTLPGIIRHDRYHAYLTMTRIAQGVSIDTVWQEYLHFPAPKATGRRDRPARTGDSSLAIYLQWPRPPLPGGWVEHTVRDDIHALANVTTRAHFLYPGYIIRWIEREADGAIVSYTLGRGIGMMPETNENKGAEMFMDLDGQIQRSLASRARR